jgi:hypothetical protein
MFRSSDRILWQVPWLIPAIAVISSTILEQLAHINVATSWNLSSVLTVLGWPVCSSSSKLSLPCVKRLCHLNSTTAQGVFAIHLLHHLKVSLADLPNFWQNLMFACCSNCDILDFRFLQTTTLHNSDFLSEYSTRMQLLLAGMREEWTRHHLVAPCICCTA